MSTVIKVENLSKYYRLGQIGGATLREDLQRGWAKLLGRPDPLSPVAGANHGNRKGDEIWALNDVSFEVGQGEILGVIGRNGAGKSTLLKILSRITAPTSGRVTITGRVGSLLEVGTGFHPELTGRENIYLNGTILGMTKAEVTLRLEEIVEFAEMGKFIDTPVKRYSSGMTVRLAFSVAAHLQPEILIIDEVLAVGDAAFQAKCLGKIGDVAGGGRTVLFVSHNMTSIRNLCSSAIRLANGALAQAGNVDEVIESYLTSDFPQIYCREWKDLEEAPGNHIARLCKIELSFEGSQQNEPLFTDMELFVEYVFYNYVEGQVFNISSHLRDPNGTCIFNVWSEHKPMPKGYCGGILRIPPDFLNDGHYSFDFMVVSEGMGHFHLNPGVTFEVHDRRRAIGWYGKVQGVIRPLGLQIGLNPLNERSYSDIPA